MRRTTTALVSSLGSTLNLLILILALGLGRLALQNPMLFGIKVKPDDDVRIVQANPILDAILQRHYETQLAFKDEEEFVTFRNHCLRMLTWAELYWPVEQKKILLQKQNDKTKKQKKSVAEAIQVPPLTQQQRNVMALGVAYHWMGFWLLRNRESIAEVLPYSMAWMEREALQQEQQHQQGTDGEFSGTLPKFSPSDIATARQVIAQQFRWKQWNGQGVAKKTSSNPQTVEFRTSQRDKLADALESDDDDDSSGAAVDVALVNAMRRAFWTDLSYGLLQRRRRIVSSATLEAVFATLPDEGGIQRLLWRKTQTAAKSSSMGGGLQVLWHWYHLLQW